MKNQKTKNIVKITVNVLLWVFLVFALLVTVLAFTAQANNSKYPVIGNKCLFSVATPSMDAPGGFGVGDLIVCTVLTPEDKANLKVNDVITYYTDLPDDGIDGRVPNTHRIVEIDSFGLIWTKGDANPGRDSEPVGLGDIEAIWTGTRIPLLGGLMNFLRTGTGFLLCVVLPLVAFFVYELIVLIRTIGVIRGKDARKLTAEEEALIKQRAVEEYLARQAAQNATAQTADTSPEQERKE